MFFPELFIEESCDCEDPVAIDAGEKTTILNSVIALKLSNGQNSPRDSQTKDNSSCN
jgi:hypothetical protein